MRPAPTEEAGGLLKITLSPSDEYYARGNDAWNAQVVDLDRVVRRRMPESIERPPGDDGGVNKGELLTGTVIVKILTSSGVGKLFECVKTWIQRHPGQRKLEMSWT